MNREGELRADSTLRWESPVPLHGVYGVTVEQHGQMLTLDILGAGGLLLGRATQLLAASPKPPTPPTGWDAAMEDPAFRASLDEGLADVAAGRTVPWRSQGTEPPTCTRLHFEEIVEQSKAESPTSPVADLDVERLAWAIHETMGRATDHTGPVCRYCREDAATYAAAYARLTGIPVSDTGKEPEREAVSIVGQALDILDVIDGIVDDTHPEGHECALCSALDDLRETLDRAEAAVHLLYVPVLRAIERWQRGYRV